MTDPQPDPAGDYWRRKAQPVTVTEGSPHSLAAALERVRSLAQSWASLEGDDVASEVDSRLGLLILGMLDDADGAPGGPGTRLDAVEALAETWERPGEGLFYPVAGQAVLDALRGPRAVPALPVGAVLSEGIRIRLADAMYDSIDRCARCKVCEHQIGAAAKVMAEAVSAERERAEAAERKLADLAAALRNALEGLEEMLPYVPEYFQYKWDLGAYVTRAKSALTIIGSEEKGGAPYDRDFDGPVL